MNALTTTDSQENLPRYFRRVFKTLKTIKSGAIEISLPDGRLFKAQGAKSGPVARIDVVNGDCFARLVRDGEVGFMEAYMDQDWETPDIQCFMDVVFMNNDQIGMSYPGAGLVKIFERLRHWLNSNTKR